MGFMGSGKTYLGKPFAKKIGYDFVDFDKFIEQKTKQTISEIFSAKGEMYFRQLETHLLESLKPPENLVVSLGGGTPCYNNNIDWLNANGMSIYLKVDPKIIYNRLIHQRDGRPLIEKLKEEEFLNYILNKLPQREAYYVKAKKIINADTLTVNEMADQLTPFLPSSETATPEDAVLK